MNSNPRSGSGTSSCIVAMALVASITLNAAFLAGCVTQDTFVGKGGRGGTSPHPIPHGSPANSLSSESSYLGEIATMLGVPPQPGQQPSDIARNIKSVLAESEEYSGEVFSDTAFDECMEALTTTKKRETFKAYHKFVKKVTENGRKVIIVAP